MPKPKREKFERSIRILSSVAPEASSWFMNFGKGKGQLLCKALREYIETHGIERPTSQAETELHTSPSDCRMTFRLYYPQDADLIEWIQSISGDDWNYVITVVVLDYYRNHYVSGVTGKTDNEQKPLTVTMPESSDEKPETDANPNAEDLPGGIPEKTSEKSNNQKKAIKDDSKRQSAPLFLSQEQERTLLQIIFFT